MNDIGTLTRYVPSKTIRNESVVFFDVDGTLILPDEEKYKNSPSVSVLDPIENKYIPMRKHEPNIRLLVEENHRGSFVVVWSRGGHEWAESVVKALNLYGLVDLIITKPHAYFDDVKIEDWLKNRVFLDHDTKYKR